MNQLIEPLREQYAAVTERPVTLVLAGLVVSFIAIRTSARLIRAGVRWWPGNVVAGGVHLHHQLFGVVIMIVTGTCAFVVPATSGWQVAVALGFGIGTGLVLDEFALLLHLEDVYWTREGRASLDAVLVAVLLGGMLVLSASPFGLRDLSNLGADPWDLPLAVALVALNIALTAVTALKGKYWVALLSVPLWAVGLLGAFRLARPGSPWARRRYPAGSAKAVGAQRRSAHWDRVLQSLVIVIGGRFDG